MRDTSGDRFLNDLMNNEPSVINYILNATGNKKYDFKTNGPNGEIAWLKKKPKGMTRAQ